VPALSLPLCVSACEPVCACVCVCVRVFVCLCVSASENFFCASHTSQQRLDKRGDLPPESEPVRLAEISQRRAQLVLNVHALDDDVKQHLKPANFGRQTELGRETGDQLCARQRNAGEKTYSLQSKQMSAKKCKRGKITIKCQTHTFTNTQIPKIPQKCRT
jgi:hypothetical protein